MKAAAAEYSSYQYGDTMAALLRVAAGTDEGKSSYLPRDKTILGGVYHDPLGRVRM